MHTFVFCCLTGPGLESDDRTASSDDSLIHAGSCSVFGNFIRFTLLNPHYARQFVMCLKQYSDHTQCAYKCAFSGCSHLTKLPNHILQSDWLVMISINPNNEHLTLL